MKTKKGNIEVQKPIKLLHIKSYTKLDTEAQKSENIQKVRHYSSPWVMPYETLSYGMAWYLRMFFPVNDEGKGL